MSKRIADNQISKDDADDDSDEGGIIGHWKAAPPEVLAQRKIVKVTGRAHGDAPSTTNQNPIDSSSASNSKSGDSNSGNNASTMNPFAVFATAQKISASASATAEAPASAQSTSAVPSGQIGDGAGQGFGFGAYAKMNPFAAAFAKSTTATANTSAPAPAPAPAPAAAPALASSSLSASNSATTSTSENSFAKASTLPPTSFAAIASSSISKHPALLNPIVIPSPKSPKANPFASASPSHNPFMSIVESTEAWNSVARTAPTSAETEPGFFSTATAPSSAVGNGPSFFSSDVKQPASSSSSSSSSSISSSSSFSSETTATTSASASQLSGSIFASSETNAADDEEDAEGGAGADQGEGDEDAVTGGSIYKTYQLDAVKYVSGEEDEDCALLVRAKLYRFNLAAVSKGNGGSDSSSSSSSGGGSSNKNNSSSTDDSSSAGGETSKDTAVADWVEVGVGPVKVLVKKTASKDDKAEKAAKDEGGSGNGESAAAQATKSARLVMRREEKKGGLGTKLIINTHLQGYASVAKQGDKMVRFTCINAVDDIKVKAGNPNAPPVPSVFMFKTKLPQEADKLFDVINSFVSQTSITKS